MQFHSRKKIQLVIALIIGILFGFLLQKGNVTKFDIIIKQLLFTNNTVLKVMMSAMVTGMLGVYILKQFGLANLHPKNGSVGSTILGGFIFGLGFALLGYCPGTLVGAAGQGALDALFGGVPGVLIGTAVFSFLSAKMNNILKIGYFGNITFPELLKINPWLLIVPICVTITAFLCFLKMNNI